MKKTFKLFGFIALVAVIGFSMAVCSSLPHLPGDITISVQGGGAATPGKTLEANYTGEEAVTYQWRRGLTNLGTAATQVASEEGRYSVTVSFAEFRSKTSASINVAWPDLSGNITISIQGGGAATTGATLVANYSGSETVTYQWRRGLTNLGTATTQVASEPGIYTVIVSSAGYQSKSANRTVTAPAFINNNGEAWISTTLGIGAIF